MDKLLACPECGTGTVELVKDGMIGRKGADPDDRSQWVRAPFGACNSCEFCIEVKK